MNLQLPYKLHFDFLGSSGGINVSGRVFLWFFKLQFAFKVSHVKTFKYSCFTFYIHVQECFSSVLCSVWKLLKKFILTYNFFLELKHWISKDDFSQFCTN